MQVYRDIFLNSNLMMKYELELLLIKIREIFSKKIYNYSNMNKLLNILPENLDKLSLADSITVIYESLQLLMTNKRNTANLSTLEYGSKKSGTLLIGKVLDESMTISFPSITGYYSKNIKIKNVISKYFNKG